MRDFQEIREFGSDILRKMDSKNEKVIKWNGWLEIL